MVEVLSTSTEGYDRGAKWDNYRRIESLAENVMIAQDRVHVERYSRTDDDGWLLWETDDPNETLGLPSIGCRVSMADLYARVDFNAEEA